jgi:threonine synthase
MITPLPGIGRKQIDQGTRSLWRYAAAFALRMANRVSLGEGCTPLVRRNWHGSPTLFKLEWFAPSGSFKDRGAAHAHCRNLKHRPSTAAKLVCAYPRNSVYVY